MYDNHLINDLNNQSRLAWACRRGMLELDVLLSNFLLEVYPGLSTDDKRLFVMLLNEEDPVLFTWLMGHADPEDVALLTMVTRIREHARTRI